MPGLGDGIDPEFLLQILKWPKLRVLLSDFEKKKKKRCTTTYLDAFTL